MDHEGAGKPAVITVISEDPLVMSCGWCGWTPGCSGTAAPLLWSVIEHWLTEHWEWGRAIQRGHR